MPINKKGGLPMPILAEITPEGNTHPHRAEEVILRLDTLFAQLPDADRAEVWRGVALNLAEGYHEGTP